MNELRKTILVVEDTADFRWMAGIILEESGYDTAFAENGKEALSYLHTHAAPAAIILDLRMPVMDGWTFLDHRGRVADLATIPVVLFSCEPNLEARAVGRGVAAVLSKSAGRRAFTDTLARVLMH